MVETRQKRTNRSTPCTVRDGYFRPLHGLVRLGQTRRESGDSKRPVAAGCLQPFPESGYIMQGIMEVTVTVDNPIVDYIGDYSSIQIVNLRTDSFGEATIQLVLTPGANGDGVVDFVTALLEKSNVNHYSYSAKPGVEWTPDWEAIYPATAQRLLDEEDDHDFDPIDSFNADEFDELDEYGYAYAGYLPVV